ncbi:MAG: DUF2782 domain-containing protein [Gallionella sp.]
MQQLAQTPFASAKMHTLHSTTVTSMRFLSFLLLSVFSLTAFAAKPVPDKLEPLPPPPVFDSGSDSGQPEDEPQVTITKQPEPVVEEYRVGGKLYMIKVVPKVGPPYYLVDDQGDGKFVRQESLDSGFRPPRWVIHRF